MPGRKGQAVRYGNSRAASVYIPYRKHTRPTAPHTLYRSTYALLLLPLLSLVRNAVELDFQDTAVIDLQNLETIVVIFDDLAAAREVSFDLQQKAGKSFDLFRQFAEFGRIGIDHTEKGRSAISWLQNKTAVRQADELLFIFVVFIGNLSDNLFQDILHRHIPEVPPNSSTTIAIWILLVRQFLQEIVDLLRLRHEIGRTDQTLPTDVSGFSTYGKRSLIYRIPLMLSSESA